jgi:hypothetical protein
LIGRGDIPSSYSAFSFGEVELQGRYQSLGAHRICFKSTASVSALILLMLQAESEGQEQRVPSQCRDFKRDMYHRLRIPAKADKRHGEGGRKFFGKLSRESEDDGEGYQTIEELCIPC